MANLYSFPSGAPISSNKVERGGEPLSAKHGVSVPRKLPLAVQEKVLRRVLQFVPPNFSSVSPHALEHSFRSFLHPAFLPALKKVRVQLATRGVRHPLMMTGRVSVAVVLAAFGLPVAPFDLNEQRVLAKPSNDIDTVLQLFSGDKEGACAGYSTCAAPFYLLVTDCLRTLSELLPVHPELSELRSLYTRANIPWPSDPGRRFVPGIEIFSRQPGDTISTRWPDDEDPRGGSITLIAGWELDGQPFGAPIHNTGYFWAPEALLQGILCDPRFASSIGGSVSASPTVH
jgi:hypothetical protein